jgi:hypothetical protein
LEIGICLLLGAWNFGFYQEFGIGYLEFVIANLVWFRQCRVKRRVWSLPRGNQGESGREGIFLFDGKELPWPVSFPSIEDVVKTFQRLKKF